MSKWAKINVPGEWKEYSRDYYGVDYETNGYLRRPEYDEAMFKAWMDAQMREKVAIYDREKKECEKLYDHLKELTHGWNIVRCHMVGTSAVPGVEINIPTTFPLPADFISLVIYFYGERYEIHDKFEKVKVCNTREEAATWALKWILENTEQ